MRYKKGTYGHFNMKIKSAVILFWMVSFISHSLICQRNLIPNPSFEDYFDCEYDLISDRLETVIPHWHSRATSPRFFHNECDNYQAPLSAQDGQGFISLIGFTKHIPDFSGQQLRNYATVELTEPIKPGKTYYLEYYIAPTWDRSTPHSHHGVLFSDSLITEPYSLESPWPNLDETPQLENDQIVGNKINQWAQQTYCYSPKQEYSVVTFGVFAPLDSIKWKSHGSNQVFSSYDNFLLVEVEDTVKLEISQDTICAGQCITLTTNHSKITGTFQWALPGSSFAITDSSQVTVCYDQPGQYDVHVDINHECGAYQGHFSRVITVVDSIDFLPKWDTIKICPGDNHTYDINSSVYHTQWLDGHPRRSRMLSQEGNYRYTASNGFCSDTFEVQLQFLSQPESSINTYYKCSGQTIVVQQKNYSMPGIFIDTLRNSLDCDSIYQVTEIIDRPIQKIQFDPIQPLCDGEEINLRINSQHHDLRWSNGFIGHDISIAKPGRYAVMGVDQFGCSSDTFIDISLSPSPTVTTHDLTDIWFYSGIPLVANYSDNITFYQWSPAAPLSCEDCPHPLLLQPEEGIYNIYVENEYGCSDQDNLLINFKSIDYFAPNIINPLSDIPDNRTLFLQTNIELLYDMHVYNRWGGLVFSGTEIVSNQSRQGWLPGSNDHTGVYVYHIQFKDKGQTVNYSGSITVFK